MAWPNGETGFTRSPLWPTQRESLTLDVKRILIVGPPRTGTTMLPRLLAGGESVLSLSEPFHLRDLLPYPILRLFYASFQWRCRLQRVPLPNGESPDDYLEFLDNLARTNGMEYLVVKEVFHEREIKPPFASLNIIDYLTNRSWAVVGIIRHPFDALASTVRLLGRLFFGGTGSLIRTLWPAVPRFTGHDHIIRWAAENWCDFVDWARRRNLFVVRYEDLVKKPAPELRRICEHTGLPFQESMLNHRRAPTAFGGIGSPNVLLRRNKPISTRSIGRGKLLSQTQRQVIRRICGERAAELGYTL